MTTHELDMICEHPETLLQKHPEAARAMQQQRASSTASALSAYPDAVIYIGRYSSRNNGFSFTFDDCKSIPNLRDLLAGRKVVICYECDVTAWRNVLPYSYIAYVPSIGQRQRLEGVKRENERHGRIVHMLPAIITPILGHLHPDWYKCTLRG